MKEFRHYSGVATLELDRDACKGCGLCPQLCPHGVLAMEQKKARVVDLDGCMECGACATNCPSGALTVSPGVGCASYIINKWLRGSKAAEVKLCC